jgi:predicted amidophosphoribosyltransferase
VTERQHRLDRAGRLRNLRDAIGLRTTTAAPAIAIVVDDILTTSATFEACASVLRSAGTREAYGFAIAREV